MHKFRRSFFSTVLLVTAALPSNGQSSAIEGSVADPSGRPIRGARVECSDATVFTSLDGQFRFPGVSRCDATVSSQGFEPRQLEMAAGVPVVATARTRRVLREVDERRKLGLGYVLGPYEIQRRVTLRSVLQSFPGVTVQGTMNSFTVFMHSGSMSRAYCVADLRIDGIPSTWDLLSSYEPKDIAAVEVYPRVSTVPLQYQNLASTCGMVLVWTTYLR